MTSRTKQHMKELKGPDQFQVKVMSLMDWGVKNVKTIAAVLAPIALIVVAGFAWKLVQSKRKDARLEELGKVQVVYDGENRKANDERKAIMKQMEDLDKKAQPAQAAAQDPTKPATPPPADPKVQAEKDALQKKAEAVKADHTASAAQFQEFYKKYEGTPEGWMAGMTAARIFIEQEKLAEARPIIEQVLDKSKDNTFYQTQARLTLIGLLEESGDYDKALTELDQLDKLVDKDLKPKVLLAKGRIQMLKNSKDDAKATFNNLIENHGTTPEAQKARSIQSLLN